MRSIGAQALLGGLAKNRKVNFFVFLFRFSFLFLLFIFHNFDPYSARNARHICSIAFEITTSNNESKPNIDRAKRMGVGFPYYVRVYGEPQRRMAMPCAFFIRATDVK